MESVFDKLFEYGDPIDSPEAEGPDQREIQLHGHSYVRREFPKTDCITTCELR